MNKPNKREAISIPTWKKKGSLANVVIPINSTLSIKSLILTLKEFEDWKLVNFWIVLEEDNNFVEMLFNKKTEKKKEKEES